MYFYFIFGNFNNEDNAFFDLDKYYSLEDYAGKEFDEIMAQRLENKSSVYLNHKQRQIEIMELLLKIDKSLDDKDENKFYILTTMLNKLRKEDKVNASKN